MNGHPAPSSIARPRQAQPLRFDRWQDHPGFGLTPERVVQIFRAAEQGYPQQQCDLFDDLAENDGHLRNLFEQRSQAVAGKPWVIQAGGANPEDQEAAIALAEAIRRIPYVVAFLEHQLSFNLYGWAATELDWELAHGVLAPTWFTNVPARRFRFSPEGELRLLTSDFATDGEPLVAHKWVVTKRRQLYTARSGLLRTAAWFALFKRYATRDWVVYAEKFGIPLVWAEYDETQDEDAKTVAEQIVSNIGDDGQAIVSKGTEVHIETAGRDAGAEQIHGSLISYCNREMSKLVNGSTLANDNGDAGGASYALGNVHDGVRFDNVVFDAERLAETFRDQIAAPFVKFNRFGNAAPPLLKMQVVRELNPSERAKVGATLANELGIPISKEQMRQELGFKEPAGDDDAATGRLESAPNAAPKDEPEADAA